jgi:molybdenum cofactor cytidylyltransferase
VRTAVEAGCLPIVVLGCAAERIQAECDLSRCQIMLHERWERGMGASMALGIASASAMQVDGAVVMTCDQPAVTPEHLQRLIAGSALGEAAASSYAGRKGVPACFPLSRFAELAKLDGDVGARELLADARSVELPGGELDIDTEDKLRQAQERFGG